jgi:phosphotransferase system  glucose/maltose/N-acetylglucosamine-specific IIC component
MRMTLIKVISFLAAFMFLQGVILPWTISNNFMPLWADIVLLALIMMMWVIVIDRVARRLIGRFKEEIKDEN